MERPQDRYWAVEGLGGAWRPETHFDGRGFRCFVERPRNLHALFRAIAEQRPQAEALVDGERRLSYAALEALAERAAAGLARRGIAAGDRVALFLGNRWEFLVAFLGCCRIGAISVPIGTRYKKPELEFLLADCGAALLLFDATLADNVPDAAALPLLRHRVAVGGDSPGAEPFDALLAPGPGAPQHDSGEEDTACLLYTSGTTGRAKGALLTHLGMIHSAYSFARCLGLTERDRALVAVPISHVTGLVGVALATLSAGGCVVLMRAYKTADFLALASRERMTYTIVVPAIYTLCMMDPGLPGHDLGAWRIGCFGGAPMPEATIAALAERLPHLVLVNAYGATETTSPATIMPPGENLAHLDSVGQVVPCGEVRIVDAEGRPLPPGQVGELWIRGPMIVPGYWNRPEANRDDFTEGFWHSGDMGAMDGDGFVRVLDRAKDMINRGGFKVFSVEVENVLNAHPAIVESAIVGRADPVLGERVHAFVVARPGASVAVAELVAYCAERLADYKVPETLEVWAEALPRNANGKLQKPVLRELARKPATGSKA